MKLFIFVLIYFLLIFLIIPFFVGAGCSKVGAANLYFIKKDKNWVLPKGYSLLYNSYTKKYMIVIQDRDWKDLKNLKLRLYHISGTLLKTDLWSSANDENATQFSDSIEAKSYAKIWYDYQQRSVKNKEDKFKPLTAQ